MWELTGRSSGPFPNACSLCAMELDRARPVGRFCDMSAFERCQQCWRRCGAPRRGVISIQERTARTEPSFGLRPLRSSPEPDRCTGSLFAAPRFCTQHEKVPLQHQASLCHEGQTRSAYCEEISRHPNAPKSFSAKSALLCNFLRVL
jgi:hypothetical protein